MGERRRQGEGGEGEGGREVQKEKRGGKDGERI